MKKILLLFFVGLQLLQANEVLQIDEFKVTIFSKFNREPVQIETSIIFKGRDVEVYDFKVVDTLNIVVGSFFLEDLLTSQGKKSFKKALIDYARDEHSIGIDYVFIQKLNIKKEPSTRQIIEAMRSSGCCD